MKGPNHPKTTPEKAIVIPPQEIAPTTDATPSYAHPSHDTRTTKQRKKDMLTALEKTLGVVATAAKMASIDRVTHYRWLGKDDKYKAEVKDRQDLALDFAETKLNVLIQAGDTQATMFLLRTRGRDRGYAERQELTGADGKDLIPKRQIMMIGGKEVEF